MLEVADLCGIARELYSGDDNMQTVADYLGVSLRKVHAWCSDLFQADRTRRIAVALLLRYAGWTQQAIADWLGVDRSSVGNFFQLEKTPQLTEADLHTAAGRDGLSRPSRTILGCTVICRNFSTRKIFDNSPKPICTPPPAGMDTAGHRGLVGGGAEDG